jgi:glutamyl-tRNA synthetase
VFAGAEIEPLIMEWIASKEWAVGKVMNAFRVTLVGAAVGPHIFELTDFIGKEETLRRARRALEVLPKE